MGALSHARQESATGTAKPGTVPPPRQRPLLSRFINGLTLSRAIGGITLIALGFTLLSAFLMRIVEPETFNFGSALWWAAQTVSTVGYGDDLPHSDGGRILAVVVMIFGIALVPAITSLIVAVFINQQQQARARRE
jgi:voltage-gated potassium channel Kch